MCIILRAFWTKWGQSSNTYVEYIYRYTFLFFFVIIFVIVMTKKTNLFSFVMEDYFFFWQKKKKSDTTYSSIRDLNQHCLA